MYWSWVASLGLIAKSRDLEAGIQASGAPMRPISKETRKHRKSEMTPTGLGDPGGAPLSPGHELSRVQSLLAAEAHVDHAAFYWRFDPFSGDNFSAILEFQAEQDRDVFGLSPDALAWVRLKSLGKWLAWTRSGQVVPPEYVGKSMIPAAQLAGGKPVAPQWGVGKTDLSQATLGINTPGNLQSITTRQGGMTESELRGYMRQTAPAQVQSRPGEAYNRLLSHAWGHPGQGRSGGGAIEPLTPRPKRQRAPAKVKEPWLKADRIETAVDQFLAHHRADPNGTTTSRNTGLAKIIERYSFPSGERQEHGMATPEEFHNFLFRDTRWHFVPDAGGKVSPDNPIVTQVTHSWYVAKRDWDAIPDRLMNATSDVYLTKQSNKDDPLWQVRYSNPLHTSGATGGDGQIVSYNGLPVYPGTFSHESGHNLSTRLYGTTQPRGDYLHKAIMSKEPPVSTYAANAPAEDFAEACKAYWEDRDRMARDFPIRFGIIDRIMKDKTYGG